MKRRYKLLYKMFALAILISFSGCVDFLDKEPVDVMTESVVLSDEAAFITHMAYLYDQMPFESFSNWIWLSYYTDEMVNCRQEMSLSSYQQYNFNSWTSSYVLIRALNNLIQKLPGSTAFTTEAAKTQALGEIKFMRAFVYYTLVQRYGGIPLITEAQQLPESGDISELHKARDKAADVFGFIEAEMTEAIELMSDKTDVYRFNKWSGLAFKAQAMLYAASMAKYHQVELDGVIGIPSAQAEHYFQSARDAAKLLIDAGKFSLYKGKEEKVENYHMLFFDETTANRERIFVEAFKYPNKGHNFDLYAAPYSHRSGIGYGGRLDPTYEMVESYEYTDNREGTLKISNPDGSPVEYSNPADLFANKDPRFFASILFPGSPWMGTTLEIYGNIIQNGVETGGTGADGLAQPESSSTAFYLAKWADSGPVRPIAAASSDNDDMLMRYAEVLLNYAEAQLELGNEPEARMYTNMVRERAGLQPLEGPLTMEDYRHERKIELAFEGNRYWDLIRWRTFDQLIYNRDSYGLWPVYDPQANTYIFRKEKLPINQYTRTFEPKFYYNKLQSGVINSNPLLVENPGY